MASKILVNIRDEVTCPICLDLLKKPVNLDCGHSFCQACITANKKESAATQEEKSSCPVCRISYESEHLRPNLHLANIAEQLRGIKMSPEGEKKKELCVRHGEKLLLFCKQDGQVICWLCERSQEHRGHQTFLIEEIVQEYQKKLQGTLQQMRKKLQEAERLEAEVKERRTSWKSQIQKERQGVQADFAELRGLLDLAEQKELQKLNKEEKVILHKLAEDESELVQQSQLIDVLISDLEHQLEASHIDILKDVTDIIQRCWDFTLKKPKTFPEQPRRVYKAPDLRGMLRGLTDLASVRCYWVDVTLNQTSNERLAISANKREVRYLWDNYQNTKRGNCYYDFSVVGSPLFTNGKHYWEVDVSKKSSWILGVCGESHYQESIQKFVVRARIFSSTEDFYAGLQPAYSMWAIGLVNESGYYAFDEENHSQKPKILSLSMTVPPSHVGVFLDYEGGTVSFYNITNHGSLIYDYSKCAFPQRICPYLNPLTCESPMTICEPGP